MAFSEVTTSTTLTSNQDVWTKTSGIKITLSSSPSTGDTHTILNVIHSDLGYVEIEGNGTDTINGLDETFFQDANQLRAEIKLYYDGSTWITEDVKSYREYTYPTGFTPTNGVAMLSYDNYELNSGILYAISTGRNGGVVNYSNVHTSGDVTVSWSALSVGSAAETVDRNIGSVHSSNVANSWVKLDFGTNITVNPATIVWQHGNANGIYRMQTYIIQGSNNDSTWDDLLDVNSDPPADAAYTYKVDTISTTSYYRYLRILQDGVNVIGNNELYLTDIEVFGRIKGFH